MAGKEEKDAERAARQAEFLALYEKLFVIQDACDGMKPPLSRKTFEGWKRNDPEFRESVVEADLKAADAIKRQALKHAGLVKWTQEDISRGVHKWVSAPVLNKLMTIKWGDEGKKDVAPPTVLFPVVGVSADDLKKILTPDAQAPAAVQPSIPIPVDPVDALNADPPAAGGAAPTSGEEGAAPPAAGKTERKGKKAG